MIVFVAVYAVLVFPWPGLSERYAEEFRALANEIVDPRGSGSFAYFRAASPTEITSAVSPIDSAIQQVPVSSTALTWMITFHTRNWGYLPTATLLALVVATPFPFWPRVHRAMVGLVLVHLFIAARIGLAIMQGYISSEAWTLDPTWRRVTGATFHGVCVSVVTTFIVPALVWLVVIGGGGCFYGKPQTMDAKLANR